MPRSFCGAVYAAGCFLARSEMSAVVVIITDVLSKKSLPMVLVQSDDMLERIAAAASDPALGNAFLPEAVDRGLHACPVHGSNGRGNFQPGRCGKLWARMQASVPANEDRKS